MVVAVTKFDIHPDKLEAYTKWAQGTIAELAAAPGLIELRGYRSLVGSPFIMVTMEFGSFAEYAAWAESDTMKRINNERRAFTLNDSTELWDASPLVPRPIRPNA